MYLWVDLWPFFLPCTDRTTGDDTAWKAMFNGSDIYEQREARIIEACAQNGVMIAPGSAYRAEEYGWFRVTFTTPKAPLQEGLRRIWKALLQLREYGD